jgi:tetratricopeptide (TPR) repeat protein
MMSIKIAFLLCLSTALGLISPWGTIWAQEFGTVWAQEFRCPNGDTRLRIDLQQLALTYDAQTFQTTVNGLWGFAVSTTSETPKMLQQASAATQQWNQLLKGLAAGYNSCAISQEQYDYGLRRIYPRLKDDVSQLEQFRQAVIKRHTKDARFLDLLLKSYLEDLREFAEISDDKIVDAIALASEQIITSEQGHLDDLSREMIRKAEEIKAEIAALAKPAAVKTEIGEELGEESAEAAREYAQGYELLQEYRFREAIPHLRDASAAVPLSAFYVALTEALRRLPDLNEAERVGREGLGRIQRPDKHEADLNSEMGLVLEDKGDLPEALVYAQRAVALNREIYGADYEGTKMSAANVQRIQELISKQKHSKRKR